MELHNKEHHENEQQHKKIGNDTLIKIKLSHNQICVINPSYIKVFEQI
jgi:hypothetical protein